MCDSLQVPKKRKDYSPTLATSGDETYTSSPTLGFLWEAVNSHQYCVNLKGIFIQVFNQGYSLSGSEGSNGEDIFFWITILQSISNNRISEDDLLNLRGQKNKDILVYVLSTANEIFDKLQNPVEFNTEQKRLFSEEFKQGGYALEILEEIRQDSEDYQDGSIFYSPYTSIVQSSMMGKSRCVKQIATHFFTVHICLRDPGATGYPTERFYKFLVWNTRTPAIG
jgi:hypothetical protein